jgi:hypothetical protein
MNAIFSSKMVEGIGVVNGDGVLRRRFAPR